MNMAQINKIHVTNEAIASVQTKQLLLEMNYIIPDNKPRINSVVDVTVVPVITNSVLNGSEIDFGISASNDVVYNALSVSEEEEYLFSTACSFTKSFRESISLDDVGQGEQSIYLISAQCDNAEVSVISDRKLMIKARVTVTAAVKDSKELEAVENFEDENMICKITQVSEKKSIAKVRAQTFVKEDIDTQGRLPAMDTILAKNATVRIENSRISDGKVIFYGTLDVDVLCSGLEGDPKFFSSSFDLDFNHSVDILEASDNAHPVIIPSVTELITDVKESGVVGVEALLSFDVEVFDQCECTLAEDAFMPGMDIVLKKEEIKDSCTEIEQFDIGICSEKISIENADICEVLFVQVQPSVCTAYIGGGNIYFDGMYTIKAYYIPKSDKNTIRAACAESTFSYTFETESTDYAVVSSWISVKNSSASMNDYGEIIVKWTGEAVAVTVGSCERCVITDATVEPSAAQEEKAIYYHFVEPGETAWDVAKQFKISPEKLCAMNQVSSDEELMSLKGIVVLKG